ncbi:MAG TPA: hypothetical protein VFN88_11505 [Caulobacteraceae bacterium]|nr:hypothetical protein [Caulobacteraceae bacterium]
MFGGFPVLAVPVAVYNAMAFFGEPNSHGHAFTTRLLQPQGLVRMSSGAAWSPTLSDLILALAIGAVFVDVVSAINARKDGAALHVLSALLLAVCSLEFLLLPSFATSTFALITLMSLFSVSSGLTITAMQGWGGIDHGFKSRQ